MPSVVVMTQLSPTPIFVDRYSFAAVRGMRLSFRWWQSLTQRTCACGQPLDVMQYEPAYQSLKEDGCWDASCPKCGRIVTLYDLGFNRRQPPRGPAPTQYQRLELGWTDEEALDAYG